MLELLLGIIAFVVILVGIVAFGEGGYHWLTSVTEASRDAWAMAINSQNGTSGTVQQPYIGDWNNTSGSSTMLQGLGLGYLPGTSTSVLQYNFQDTQMGGSPAAFNSTAQQVLCQSMAGNRYIDYGSYTEPYLPSQKQFAQALQQSTTGGWMVGMSPVHTFALGQINRGNGQPVVDFGYALQNLVYGHSPISMQSQMVLPPLSNLQ